MSQVNLSFRDKNMRYSLETATMQLKVIASADGNSVQIPTQAEELKQLKLSILHLEFSPLETHKAKVFLETP